MGWIRIGDDIVHSSALDAGISTFERREDAVRFNSLWCAQLTAEERRALAAQLLEGTGWSASRDAPVRPQRTGGEIIRTQTTTRARPKTGHNVDGGE